MILSILAVIVTLGLVIFLHESGHFLVCKRLGVRVERFAFGFGPELVGVTYGGTRFSICAIPLGGFVKPAGESLEDATGDPDEYFSRSPWQRLLIVAAGPVMNYVLAFLMFFSVIFIWGMPRPSGEPVIQELAPDFPAAAAGLKPGDRVLKVDGVEVAQWTEMAGLIHARAEQETELVVLRDGQPMTVRLTPRKDPSGRGLIGVMQKMVYEKVGVLRASKEAAGQCWFWTRHTVVSLAENLLKWTKPEVAGPIGIMQMASRAAHSGAEDLLFFIGLISVAIGFLNLLPIPLLDGGHAVFYLWEGLSGRKPTTQAMAYANSIGLAFLLGLFLFATYNDIMRIRNERRGENPPVEEPKPAPEKAPEPLRDAPSGLVPAYE